MARRNSTEPRDVVRAAFYSLWGVLTLVLLFGMVYLYIRLGQQENEMDVTAAAARATASSPEETPVGNRPTVRLYFANPSALRLAPEDHAVALTDSTLQNCRAAINALIAGPTEGAAPTLPSSAHIRALYLLDSGELVVDFARDIDVPALHSAGAEWLMIQSLACTLTQPGLRGANDRQVSSVRFLFEGSQSGESFPSHIELAGPVRPDPALAGS